MPRKDINMYMYIIPFFSSCIHCLIQTSHMILSTINFMISGLGYCVPKKLENKSFCLKCNYFFKSSFNNVLAFIKHTIVKKIVTLYEKVP